MPGQFAPHPNGIIQINGYYDGEVLQMGDLKFEDLKFEDLKFEI